MLALKNKQVADRVAEVWGTIRPVAERKAELTKKYRNLLTPESIKTADAAKGKALFVKNCASCHKLFGEGGNVGPDLTGSQRANLEYLLENVLDPSAVVAKEYQATVIATSAGRTITGIVKIGDRQDADDPDGERDAHARRRTRSNRECNRRRR